MGTLVVAAPGAEAGGHFYVIYMNFNLSKQKLGLHCSDHGTRVKGTVLENVKCVCSGTWTVSSR